MKKTIISLLVVLATSLHAWAGGEKHSLTLPGKEGNGADSLLMARGDSCMAEYDYFHAMGWYEQVKNADSDLTQKLATCHFLRGNYRRCAELLEGVAPEELSHDGLRQLFYSHKAVGAQKEQMKWGQRLLSRYPMDSEVVADMALVLNTDKPEQALALTEAYEATDPHNILVKRQHADALFFTKRYEEAVQSYEQLLALGDSTFSVHYSLGMSYEQLATGDNNDDENIKEKSADSLLLARAVEHYGRAVTLNDSAKAWPLYHLGAAKVKLNQNAEGIHILLMALQRMQPEDAAMFNLHWALAEAYYQNQEYYPAIYDWKNCLKYRPQSLASRYNIAQTYEMIEENGVKAKQAYTEFLNYIELLRMGGNLDKPSPTLQEWIQHAEDFKANSKTQ